MDCEASMEHLLERMMLDPSAEPTNLPLSLLKAITNDFSDHMKIGSGGFAHVYKGELQNGTVIAVKKLFHNLDMDEHKFIKEVGCLMKSKHKNVVRFLGYCYDTQGKMINYEGKMILAEERQRLLCFEFLPKGSLDKYITHISQGLEWRTRYKIIKGICEGLHYLHQDMHMVHSDLKPANILLDENMVPKIADFGLARCFDGKQSKTITSKVMGSLGYLAPESYDGVITFKSDIYSLGIIIMEILTGLKGYCDIQNVLKSWSIRFKKTSQEDTWLLQYVRVCAEIGRLCIDRNPEDRPHTLYIIERLDQMERTCGFIETDIRASSATQDRRSRRNQRHLPTGRYILDTLSKRFTRSIDPGSYYKGETADKEKKIAFTRKDFGREEKAHKWAHAETTQHGLPMDAKLFHDLNELAESAKRRAEIARLRELHTLTGRVESVIKLKGRDIDTIQKSYSF